MNAPPFPLNPSVGEWNGNWVWNGVRWVCSPSSGIRVVIQTFTASGPYMPSPGLVTAVVECIGAGGAGGDITVMGYANAPAGAGGGGSGGYSRIALAAALVMGGVQVTVGLGANAPSTASGGAVNGAATTFGALCVANGGQSAWSYGPTSNGDAGVGGLVGMGDVTFPGSAGTRWMTTSQPGSSAGAFSHWANGGQGGTLWGGNQIPDNMYGSNDGLAGDFNTGSGGGGAQSNDEALGTQRPGGRGSDGICIVTEYCFATPTPSNVVDVNARVAVTHVPWPGPGPCPPGWGEAPSIEYEGE